MTPTASMSDVKAALDHLDCWRWTHGRRATDNSVTEWLETHHPDLWSTARSERSTGHSRIVWFALRRPDLVIAAVRAMASPPISTYGT